MVVKQNEWGKKFELLKTCEKRLIIKNVEIKNKDFIDLKEKHPDWDENTLLINSVLNEKLKTDRIYLSRCCWVVSKLKDKWFYGEKTNRFKCPNCWKAVIPLHILDSFKELWINWWESVDLES